MVRIPGDIYPDVWRAAEVFGDCVFQWPYFRIMQANDWLDIKQEAEMKAYK